MTIPTLLAMAKADLTTAKKLVNSANKYEKHLAAYHTQQAIEKTLKYVIELKLGHQPWGHDIRALVMQGKKAEIYIPAKIEEKADVYTVWETTARYYPTKVIYRNTIAEAMKTIEEWHRELAKNGII